MPFPKIRKGSGEDLEVRVCPDNVPGAFQDQGADVGKDGQLWLVSGYDRLEKLRSRRFLVRTRGVPGDGWVLAEVRDSRRLLAMTTLDGYGADVWEKQVDTGEYLVQSGIMRGGLVGEGYVGGFHEVANLGPC